MRRRLQFLIGVGMIGLITMLGPSAHAQENDDDFTWMYFGSEHILYRTAIETGLTEQLTSVETNHLQMNWSPDGEWIFLVQQDGTQYHHLYRMRPNGDALERISSERDYETLPVFSPNGEWAAFTAGFADNGEKILLYHLDDNQLIELTTDQETSTFAAWSPDGEWIYFHGNYSTRGVENNIFRIRIDGSDEQEINPVEDDRLESLSPDGEWIIYYRTDYVPYSLFRMHLDGSDNELITDHLLDNRVFWTPDDDSMLFHAVQDDSRGVFSLNIGESTAMAQRLTDPNTSMSFDSFSPDGEWIILSILDPTFHLGRVRIDGSDFEILTAGPEKYSFVDWTPNNEQILYGALSDTDSGLRFGLMNPDGSHAVELTDGTEHLRFIDWSPDGEWMLMEVEYDDFTQQLFRMRLDGSEREMLTDAAPAVEFLSWSYNDNEHP